MLETTMKIWADSFIAQGIEKVALKMLELRKALKLVRNNRELILEKWYEYLG